MTAPRRPTRGLALLALLLLAGAAGAQPADLALTGRVIDGAGILRAETERALEAELAAHEAATTNQVVVVTVPSLEGETVEQAAYRLFQAWGLGQADRDNGVLVLIARAERELRIEVGLGLEGDLTDAQAGRIIRHEFVPAFRDGDYDGGTLAGVSAILGTIEGTYEPAGDEGGLPWFIRALFTLTHIVLPMTIAARGLFAPGCGRYFILAFCLVFIGIGGSLIWWPFGPWIAVGFTLLFLLADLYMMRSPTWRRARAEVAAATKAGRTTRVRVGGLTMNVGGGSSGGRSGGGGFSGGGGSSGGGGASGSW